MASDAVVAFKRFKSEIYDSTPGYRFIEALRNYSQHRELPLHILTHHLFAENTNDLDNSPLVTAMSFAASKEILVTDEKFKKSALEGMPDKIDIIQSIRFHMEGIWRLHDYLSKNLNALADKSRGLIANAISRFTKMTGESSIGLHACAQTTETHVAEQISMLLDWDDARRTANRNLANLTNLPRRYITGKAQTQS